MNRYFTLYIIFIISFLLLICFFVLGYNKIYKPILTNNIGENFYSLTSLKNSVPTPFLKIAVLADSHSNFSLSNNILTKISSASPDLIVHLGDHTDYGDKTTLIKAVSFLEFFSFPFAALPGDRDIAQSQNLENFSYAFGSYFPNSEIVDINGLKVFFFSNMYNFTPFTQNNYRQIMQNVVNADVIFSSQPLYVPDYALFSTKYMGSNYLLRSDNGYKFDPSVFKNMTIYTDQSSKILTTILERKTPLLVVSGDHHKSSTFTHPNSNIINFHIVGALAENIESGNLKVKQTALQSRRFSILNFYRSAELPDNFTYKIEEIEILD